MSLHAIGARAVVLALMLVPCAVHAQVIPGTCWGNCGERDRLSGCWCNSSCQARGDCCPDKDTLCYGQLAVPLCPLVKFDTSPAVWGTDMGTSFEHKGKNEIFFGDTWSKDTHPGGCTNPPASQADNDDAMATLDVARPASLPTSNPNGPVTCPVPAFRTIDSDSFKPLTVSYPGGNLPMEANITPQVGWSDGTTAFTWVMSLYAKWCFSGCRDGLTCDAQTQFCMDPTGGPTPDKFVRSVEIAYRPDENNPTAFVSGNTFYTNKFLFPSVATVTTFDPATPANSNYKRGYGTLLVFGRPWFHDEVGQPLMYLAYQHLASLKPVNGVINWAPQYFAGTDTSGKPTWTANVANAKPLNPTDFTMPGFHDVAWIDPLRKWVMLYGGDFGGFADDTQARKGAIHVRMADHPWGPWTPPVPLLIRELAGSYMGCDPANTTYGTGPWKFDSDGWLQSLWIGTCQTSYRTCGPGNPAGGLGQGNFYGPNFIESWTYNAGNATYPRAAQIYFNVSTLSPYQVILATARLELPPEGPVTYKRPMHLRAFDGELVTVGADGTAVPTRRPADFTTHMQILYKANPLASGNVTGGNHVLIRADDGRYLRRRGNTLVFESAIVADSEWIIERYAGPGAVQPETDVIRILSATDDRHIKLKPPPEGLRAYGGAGVEANFTLTWGCKIATDDCM